MITVENKGKSNKVMTLNLTMASFNKSRVQVLLEESLKVQRTKANPQNRNYSYAGK